MPFADSTGTKIHYEVQGSGEAVLLVPGLGGSVRQLAAIAESLATTHRVISVDPRGAAESDKPDMTYDGALLAGDMIAVLDHAGAASVHVAGISFGGMIGQEMALRHPSRVSSLLLASSYAASDAWTDHMWHTRELLLDRLGLEGHFAMALMFLFSPRVFRENPEVIARIKAGFAAAPPDPVGYRRQLQFCRDHDARSRLHAITAPTLVVTGGEDILSSPLQGRELAALIPAARYHEPAACSHLFMLLQPAAFADLIREATACTPGSARRIGK